MPTCRSARFAPATAGFPAASPLAQWHEEMRGRVPKVSPNRNRNRSRSRSRRNRFIKSYPIITYVDFDFDFDLDFEGEQIDDSLYPSAIDPWPVFTVALLIFIKGGLRAAPAGAHNLAMSLPRLILLALSLLSLLPTASAREIHLAPGDPRPTRPLELHPGDVVILADGEWRDLSLHLTGTGTAAQPIVLRPASPGGARLTGRGGVSLAGAFFIVHDLHFDGLLPAPGHEALVSFRGRAGEASSSRLSGCRFTACNPGNLTERFAWVRIYGRDHRVDHNRFESMDFNGVTIQIMVRSDRPAHRIDHNHFYRRTVGSGNGFECIQIGQSGDSHRDGGCLVENNLFEQCDGETEIVSNKTNANIYRGNRFLRSAGTLTLRHGQRCVVEGNVFLGDGKPGTGGVRVIDADHRIIGNHFEGLTGVTGGIVVLYQGVPDSSANGYFAAHRALIEHNTFRANAGPAIFLNGGEGGRDRTILPTDAQIVGNDFGPGSGARAVAVGGSLPDVQGTANRIAAGVALGTAPADFFAASAATSGDRAAVDPSWGTAAVGPIWDTPSYPRVLWHPQAVARLGRSAALAHSRDALLVIARAERASAKIYSVTTNAFLPPSGDRRDYYSTGPYWWPNPDTADGLPYLQRDGQFNPERDVVSDREPLHQMVAGVQHATLAWWLTGERAFAQRAALLLRTWFLDPVTGMHPHLNHAQAIPGRTTGRGRGIIDALELVDLLDGLGLLASSPDWPTAEQEGLRTWFTAYGEWLATSPLAEEERRARNNHGTAFDLQEAAIAAYLGRTEKVQAILSHSARPRITAQIEPDGSQPLELARTRSWSYVTENLWHFYRLARLGESHGETWLAANHPAGERLRAALQVVLPAACDPASWPHAQETAWQWEYLRPVLALAIAHEPGNASLRQAKACLPPPDLAAVLATLVAPPPP